MSWLEWMLWRWENWRGRRPCRQGLHEPVGPSMCADGRMRFACSRGCGWRILEDDLMRYDP